MTTTRCSVTPIRCQERDAHAIGMQDHWENATVSGTLQATNLSGHVHKAGIVALERHGHGGGRAIPVLGHDKVRLTGPRRFFLVLILAVQKDNDVRVLFY